MLFKKWREAPLPMHKRFVVIYFSLVLNHHRLEPYSFSQDKVNNKEQYWSLTILTNKSLSICDRERENNFNAYPLNSR